MAQETTGKADFKVGGDTYQTWYKVVGDLTNAQRRPVIAIHGGPGMSHHYMLPHTTLFTRAGIPVIFYDQLGNGQSSHIHDAPKEFWKAELFMAELDNLLEHLGIADDYDLLGQSWGGMLAGNFVATRIPKGLKHLIIANSPASIELFEKGTTALLEKFPKEFVTMLRKHEEKGTFQAQEYQDGMMQFYKKHICQLDPWPADLTASFTAVEENPTVYHTMLGPAEFNIIGTLKKWSIIDILHRIPCPTLLINSPLDEVQDISVLPWFLHVPKIKWVQLQNSTHLAQFEEPERYFDIILDFLTVVV